MSKISELSDGGSLVSSDYLIAVRSGGNVKVRMDQINVDQIDLGDNEFIRLGNSQDLTIVHDASNSIINQAGIGDLLIQKAGSTKLTVNSSGIDVTGTVTADGLTVANTGNITLDSGTGEAHSITLSHKGSYAEMNAIELAQGSTTYGNNQIKFLNMNSTGSVVETMRISGGGDISFYEDTGTTPKLTWSASNESLTVPTLVISDGAITTTAAAGDHTVFNSTGADADFRVRTGANTHSLYVEGNTGNVGIGTSSPTFAAGGGLQVQTDTFSSVRVTETGNTGLDISQAADGKGYVYLRDNADLLFGTNNTEAMRLDSSNNLLVGKNATTFSSTGVELRSNDQIWATATSDNSLALNRLSTDGDIAKFYKDGTEIGSIQAVGGDLNIGTGDTALLFVDSIDAILPSITTNPAAATRDNAIDLGRSATRFDDIYATNGTIQTSDSNEKQDIEALSDAEQRVAVSAKGLLRKFRWQSSVAEKGDEARIHFGIIAQDLQDAFTAEGLDAGDYAMFIHSTWTDEETGEERSRMGVRYSELLAFIIAAI